MLSNIPISLTYFRIIIIPFFIFAFFLPSPSGEWISCWIFVIAAITDYLDGKLARELNQESKLGSLLDPVADKIIVTVALVLMVHNKTIDDYNDYVYEMVQDFRDFTIMHYRYATRSDTKFWQDQKEKPIPQKLQEQMKLFENGSLECLYKTTHIYFMFQTALGFKFIKKPKTFNYYKDIKVPTFEAIERIKEKHSIT